MSATIEYRVWITIPRLPLSEEGRWEPLIEDIERRSAGLGPVLSWEDGDQDALVVVAVDAESDAEAAKVAVEAIADSLDRVGLGELYPASVEVEPLVAGAEALRA